MNKKNEAAALEYNDVKVGMTRTFERLISPEDVEDFARLSGDLNPIHTDEGYAAGTQFKGRIVHGMLSAALFSTLIGMHLPGKYSIIISQEIKYMRPIRPGSSVKVTGKVTGKTDAVKVVLVEHSIADSDGKIAVNGASKIKMVR